MKNNKIVNPFDVENTRYYHYTSLDALLEVLSCPNPFLQ